MSLLCLFVCLSCSDHNLQSSSVLVLFVKRFAHCLSRFSVSFVSQVYNNYGREDSNNAHLLLNYGFALTDNRHDYLPMHVDLSALVQPSVRQALRWERY